MNSQSNLIINRKRSILLLVLPTALALFIVLIPILYMFRVSLYPASNVSAHGAGWTLNNYINILTDPFYLKILGRTVLVGLGTGVFCTIIGYPVALYMSRCSARKQQIMTLLLVAPLYTSIIIRCYAWIVILGNKGIINGFLNLVGINSISMLYSYFSVYLGLVYVFLAYMILSIFNVLVTIKKDVEEASMIMGASRMRTFIEVTFPLSLPGVFAGFLLDFVPATLGGAKMGLIPNYVYSSVINTFNWTQGSSLAFIYIITTFIVLILYFTIVKRFSRYLAGSTGVKK